MREFLEVMQPASKPKTWATQADSSSDEPPTKVQAIEAPEAESDGEYEQVPKKTRKTSPLRPGPVQSAQMPIVLGPPEVTDETTASVPTPNATDDDWLRSRTNRLLDLMDPEDIAAGTKPNASLTPDAGADTSPEIPSNIEEPLLDEIVEEQEKPDPTIEAIKLNGRLFIRNLPYTASEDDIRDHFSPFGSLEEV